MENNKVITIEDARKIINDFTRETYFKLEPILNSTEEDSIYKNEIAFQNYLMDLICYKWSQMDPDMFLKCYVTDESYNTLSGAAYSWYMTFRNKANLNDLLQFRKCKDCNKIQEAPRKIYNRRYNLVKEIAYTTNIVHWIMQNIKIQ